MHKKLFHTALAIFLWGILAFTMSIIYYWLKDKGLIWDEPDQYKLPDGTWQCNEMSWNTRKVIMGLLGLASFVLTVIKIIFIWDEENQ